MRSGSKLPETFKRVRRSVIAFASGWATIAEGEKPSLLPNIIGTGFIVDERGIVATNRHVVEALAKLPAMTGRPTSFAMVFTEIVVRESARTIGVVCVRLKRRFIATEVVADYPYYGQLAEYLASATNIGGDITLRSMRDVLTKIGEYISTFEEFFTGVDATFYYPRSHGEAADLLEYLKLGLDAEKKQNEDRLKDAMALGKSH